MGQMDESGGIFLVDGPPHGRIWTADGHIDLSHAMTVMDGGGRPVRIFGPGKHGIISLECII